MQRGTERERERERERDSVRPADAITARAVNSREVKGETEMQRGGMGPKITGKKEKTEVQRGGEEK